MRHATEQRLGSQDVFNEAGMYVELRRSGTHVKMRLHGGLRMFRHQFIEH